MRKYLKALTNLAVALVSCLLFVFLTPKLLLFFAPFIVGWLIALVANPVVQFFERRFKIRRKAGSAVVIVLVIGLVVFVFYLAGVKLAKEAVGLMNDLPLMWEGAKNDFGDISRKFSVIYNRLPKDMQQALSNVTDKLGDFLGSMVGKAGSPTIEYVGNFAKQLPAILIGMIMVLLSSYLFVAEREEIIEWLRCHVPCGIVARWEMVRQSLIKAMGGYLKAQLRIELWMYLLLVVGLSLLQVNYVLLIAFLIALLDVLPFLGTGTVLVPWAVIKILSSDYQMAMGLLIIWGVGQLVRQLIQPKIVGDSVGVAPIPTLFLLYTGYKLGGVAGMIVAVPIGLIGYTLYKEGVFDTTQNSILILLSGLNRFRRLNEEDLRSILPEVKRKDTDSTNDKEKTNA